MNPAEVLMGWWWVLVLLWRNSKAAETQHHIQCQNPKRPDSAALSAHYVLVVWWHVAPARRWRRLTPSSQQDALIDGYSLQRISAACSSIMGFKNVKLRFISRVLLM